MALAALGATQQSAIRSACRKAGAVKIVFLDFDGVLNSLSRPRSDLCRLLAKLGFVGRIAGCTPDLSRSIRFADYGAIRCSEIRAWLQRSAVTVERFVVLDDADLEEVEPHLVRTTIEHGLLDDHVEAALQLLGLRGCCAPSGGGP